MRLKEIYTIANNNVKGRKKIGKMLSVMFFLAMFILLFVNSLAKTFDDLMDLARGIPMARYVIIKEDEVLPDDYVQVIKDTEHVIGVIPYAEVLASVEGFSGHGKKSMEVYTYMTLYNDYIVNGEEPNKGEILIPEYMNIGSGGYYESGTEYIGKVIKLYVNNYNEECKIYEYTVSGTYDNIYGGIGQEIILATGEDAIDMYQYSKIDWKDALADAMEANGDDDPTNYVGFEPLSQYAFSVDEYKNIEDIIEDLCNKFQMDINWLTTQNVDASQNEIQDMFDVVQFIVAMLVIILMVVVILLMLVTVGNDIRDRKKEMAMYLIQGYTRKDLKYILTVEYAIRLFPVLLMATISTFVLMIIGNLVIDNLFSMEYQILNMSLDWGTFLICIVVLLIVLGTAASNIHEQLYKISLIKEIKSEG